LPAEARSVNSFVASRDGTRIAYRAWPKSQAKISIAVAHGLGEHAGRYATFADEMGRRGFGVFAVDVRGHGLSPGQRGHVDSWSQWTDDISAFLDEVGRQVTGEVVPLGHSFGGAAVLSAALDGKLPGARRFIVSSPALRTKLVVPQWKMNLGDMASRWMPRLAMSNDVDAGTLSRIPEVVAAYQSDPLVHPKISSRLFTEWQAATKRVLDHASQITLPFLIIAGADDRLIDPAGSEELHRRNPARSELHVLPGRYHEPFNDLDSGEVFDLIARWLNAG
jgi:alpha-beta hydrolase superfamily lysophospholipase